MKYKEYGFGTFGWEGKDIAIAGGIRDHGFHPAGQMRCIFEAYDAAKAIREGKRAEKVGTLVLLVNLGDGAEIKPTIDKLIKIEIPKQLRRQGLGRRIVAAALEAAAGDMEICDIRRNAMGFWRKVGAEDFTGSKTTNAVLRKAPAPVPESAEAAAGPTF